MKFLNIEGVRLLWSRVKELSASENTEISWVDDAHSGLKITLVTAEDGHKVYNFDISDVQSISEFQSIIANYMTSAEIESELGELDSKIDSSVGGVETKVNTLIADDTGKSARVIAAEELSRLLIPEGAKESLDTLQEIADWIQQHPDDASAMNQAIENLKTFVGIIPPGASATTVTEYAAELVSSERSRAEGVESGHGTRIGDLETKVGSFSVSDQITSAIGELDWDAKSSSDNHFLTDIKVENGKMISKSDVEIRPISEEYLNSVLV